MKLIFTFPASMTPRVGKKSSSVFVCLSSVSLLLDRQLCNYSTDRCKILYGFSSQRRQSTKRDGGTGAMLLTIHHIFFEMWIRVIHIVFTNVFRYFTVL